MYLGTVGTYLSSPPPTAVLRANVDNIATGIMGVYQTMQLISSDSAIIPYFTISVSLNILLTLMIVVRLILYNRSARAATGETESGGMYKAIVTMLIESCALYAVNSLLFIGLWGAQNYAESIFLPILAETQVRVFP